MAEQQAVKKCSRCGTEKPLTAEFFQRDRSMRDGFKAACKICKNARQRAASSVTQIVPVERSPEEEALSVARQYALRKLVEEHPREFQQHVNYELERLGFPKRWKTAL